MRIIHIQIYVLMWCQAAETLDQLTSLGQNVSINCDLDSSEVYWILLKQSDSTVILQSFLNPPLAFHFNKTLKKKYSVQSKHRLVIYNVTHDELGVYCCVNMDKPPKVSNSTRLHIMEIQDNWTHWKTFSLISGLLNAVLIITVVGLIKVYVIENGFWTKSGKSSGQSHSTDLQQTQVSEQHQDPNQVQYAAMDFSKMHKNVRTSQDNSTYTALKLPRPKAQGL
ncbi:uncharacterized protein LOC130429884 [Triplophysa dalaica]|uniref:uncharacterized protein LOC130429884 n=1 Tax=Triplophysa dalaica TaxID=1582913 RepID=UPI0024DF5D30|nr:uncharacterized protein LOC130429884 [Triplophysa dalaica]